MNAVLTVLLILAWIVIVNFASSQYHSLAIDMMMLQVRRRPSAPAGPWRLGDPRPDERSQVGVDAIKSVLQNLASTR